MTPLTHFIIWASSFGVAGLLGLGYWHFKEAAMLKAEKKVSALPPVPRYEHKGTLDWKCVGCDREGGKAFHIRNDFEVPTQIDYLPALAEAEAEHVLTHSCNGPLVFECARRTTVVEHVPPVKHTRRLEGR
jgi:hypothetical protein